MIIQSIYLSVVCVYVCTHHAIYTRPMRVCIQTHTEINTVYSYYLSMCLYRHHIEADYTCQCVCLFFFFLFFVCACAHTELRYAIHRLDEGFALSGERTMLVSSTGPKLASNLSANFSRVHLVVIHRFSKQQVSTPPPVCNTPK